MSLLQGGRTKKMSSRESSTSVDVMESDEQHYQTQNTPQMSPQKSRINPTQMTSAIPVDSPLRRTMRRASEKDSNNGHLNPHLGTEEKDSETRTTANNLESVSPASSIHKPHTQAEDRMHRSESPIQSKQVLQKKRQPVRGNWSADHLMQSDKSKLIAADLEALLSHPKAWLSLSDEQQRELCALLPATIAVDTPSSGSCSSLPQQTLKSNSTFRSHLRLFQEELAAGHLDPIWLSDAHVAMEKRAMGEFDEWKEQERERFWGQKQKVDWSALSGDSAKWSLRDLVKSDCFQVGDVWLVQRGLRRDKLLITINKEATIVEIRDDSSMTLSYPPGQHRHSAPSNGTDKQVIGITSPNFLIKTIVAEDGRIPASHRSANAWKDIRCYRKNQDMGSLFDVREMFHKRQDNKA